jgi:hypothetical protein
MAEHFGMRPSNKQRSRNKSGNNNNNQNQNQRRSVGNIINRVFESAGPDGKVRGTPQQIIDKYQALARDAQVSGDRVAAESFLQHSEHYSRMLGEAQRHQAEQRVGQDREDGQRPEAPRYEGGRSEDGAPERGRAPALVGESPLDFDLQFAIVERSRHAVLRHRFHKTRNQLQSLGL